MNLLNGTKDMNQFAARKKFQDFKKETDNRIDKVIFKVEKLHNLNVKLNSINNSSKKAYKSANIVRDPGSVDNHVFAKVKSQL